MDISSIKKFFYKLIISAMIFFIVARTIDGIQTSDLLEHWIMMFILFGIGFLLIKPLLTFLTLPSKFIFHWLIGAVLAFASFYGMKFLLPGIEFNETVIDGKSLGILSINPTRLTPTFTMIIGSLYGAFINSLLYWLKKS